MATNLISTVDLLCPLDHSVLKNNQNSFICAQGHTFDCAKEGYVNLLPVQNKRSKMPGDNKEMVQARKQFLNTNLYEKISDALINHLHASNNEQTVLDAGCGEGYYLNRLCKIAQQKGHSIKGVGLDISKFAIQAAAKRNKDLTWLVASNKLIPLKDDSLDVLICAFGFPVYAEFAKKLKSQGKLILIETAEHHQKELKNILYPQVKPYSELKLQPAQEHGFIHETQSKTCYEINLNKQQIAQLLAMTPHLYRAPKTGIAAVQALDFLTLTVDVNIHVFHKA